MASLASFDTYGGYLTQTIIDQTPNDSEFIRQFYRLLFAYYKQNGLYNYIEDELSATGDTDGTIRPIKNPAWRVSEFYASKLFPGTLPEALPIISENPSLEESINQIWKWSNFSSKKQMWARWFAIFGDWFIKVNTKKDAETDAVKSVYLTLIRPEHVKDFKLDERGFITWIRIDIPFVDEEGDEYTYTEIWNKAEQTLSIWPKHEEGVEAELTDLGAPETTKAFEEMFGQNFIPIVYQSFRDDGEGRCSGAFTAQLEKIDEANRQATRLSQILFRHNRALWAATSSAKDKDGRPMPAISFEDSLNADSVLEMQDGDIISLPSSGDLKPLVPNISFDDALAVLKDTVSELSKDLPELAYYELKEGSNELSGRAIRFLLDDMINRVIEARGNAEAALIRANQMALTLGAYFKVLEGLSGTFEEGDFDHSFAPRPVLPQDASELATTIKTFTDAGISIEAAAIASGMDPQAAQDLSAVDTFGDRGLEDEDDGQTETLESLEPDTEPTG